MSLQRSCHLLFALLVAATATQSAEPVAVATVEARLATLVARPEVTVVHLWAPWCSNCRNEMKPDGWARFIAEHPSVQTVFVNIWHADQDPAPKLAAGRLGRQQNFVAVTHPNGSRRQGERLETLLGFPITWVPTTWVFKEGKLLYALNYGEIRFDMLHQMVADAAADW